MAVESIPQGYHSVTPYLVIRDATSAIAFYKKAFGASEQLCIRTPDGKIGHAEIRIGDSVIMLSDEYLDMGFRSPQSLGGAGVSILIYIADCDTCFAQAIKAGAKQLRPIENHFYGDRSGTIEDPFGHVWTISTHIEDVSPEEIYKRAQTYFQKQNDT